MNTLKKDSTNFITFLRNELPLVFFCLFCTFLTYSPKLRYYSIGIDTERMIAEPEGTLTWWLSLNRYGLVFLKRILPYGTNIYPVFVNTLTYLLFSFSIILLCYLVWRTKKVSSKSIFFVSSLIAITTPTIIEQTNFILQSIEVQIAVIFQILAIILIQIATDTTDKKKFFFLFIAIISSFFSFSVYQSLLVSFCILAIISVYFKTNSETTFFEFVKKTIPYVLVLLISFTLYIVINKIVHQLFHVVDVGYISFDFYFMKVPFSQYLSETISLIKSTFFSTQNRFFLWIPSLYSSFFALSFLFNKKNTLQRKLSLFLTLIVLSIGLGFLVLTLGWAGPMRSYYPTICFALFFVAIATFNEIDSNIVKKGLLLITIILSTSQGLFTYRLGQTSNIIYQEEVKVLNTIEKELSSLNLSSTKEYQLVTYGGIDFSYLDVKRGEMIGCSFFNYDTGFIIGNSQRVADFFISEGIPIGFINNGKKYKELAPIAEDMPSYPNKGFVKVVDNYLIVKLS
ncbi:glucosyltransferase domain-containing protein [Enterococcus sp. LJL99]